MRPPPRPDALPGHGLVLRPHRGTDLDDVVRQCRDPLMQRWTTVPSPYTPEDAAIWLSDRPRLWQDGTEYSLAVEADGRFAGSVDLRPTGAGAAEIGYGLAPWARGRGLTRRALQVILRWAFPTLGLEYVHWSAVAGNWASRRVAWSVGFQVEGTIRGLVPQRGQRLDGWIGSLRATDPLSPRHPWYRPPVLLSHRVTLREHRLEDLTAMAEACTDPLTQRWLAQVPTPYTREDGLAHLEEIAEEQAGGRAVFWAVVDTSDRMVGEIGMWGLARGESRSAEVGYWAHPAARGAGLISEAVRLVSGHALSARVAGGLGLDRLVVRIARENLPSQRVAAAAGFRPAGVDRMAQELRDGSIQDLIRFDLVRPDLLEAAVTDPGDGMAAAATDRHPGDG